ncbi:hypothetical protein [Paraburkholderia dinghuensis]|uniref:Uncharacterized protein n=1 Tax=Paraburkholderia dinghuensis TaxID=2305225 RepID=A0A3N6MXH6_9BURK|nr:hypothetical protein [Paraburkholderia dinghuensis]RQH02731.1 hypothetical protein D1Y85_21600 [Paraburkholderia dinghuensis]
MNEKQAITRPPFELSLTAAKEAFAREPYHFQYLAHYGRRAFGVWLRVWWDRRFDEVFNRFTRPHGQRLTEADLRQLVRLWITIRAANHFHLYGHMETRPFSVTGEDVVRFVAMLERDHDCVPIVEGILTADYWNLFAAQRVGPAMRRVEGK